MVDRSPRVYMAGKVSKNGWRHDLVPGLRDHELVYDRTYDRLDARVPLSFGEWEYAGPYFIGDDHGCNHGANQHGMVMVGCGTETENYVEGWTTRVNGTSPVQRQIHRSCMHWLDTADVVFSWLDALDAYGTLVELGAAHAKGLPIFLAEADPLSAASLIVPAKSPDGTMGKVGSDDLWFARQTATAAGRFPKPEAALRAFGKWWEGDMRAYWQTRLASPRRAR